MQSKSSVSARIGMLVFATSGIQFANGFFGTFIALRVASSALGNLTPVAYAARNASVPQQPGALRSTTGFAPQAVATPGLTGPNDERIYSQLDEIWGSGHSGNSVLWLRSSPTTKRAIQSSSQFAGELYHQRRFHTAWTLNGHESLLGQAMRLER